MQLFIDGEAAERADLVHQLLHPYGAFTSFRVEDGGVRGLDLHLRRLAVSSLELFGAAVPEMRLRDRMRTALGDRRDAWLRVSLFSRDIRMRDVDFVGRPSVMVGVSDAPLPLEGALRLDVQVHGRIAPHLKHVATFDLMQARRRAKQAGCDDALFVDESGRISEGSVWSIGFLQGDHVVWPEAPMLEGVAQAVIRRNLAGVAMTDERRVVRLDELGRFDGAFICNSATPPARVATIGDARWSAGPDGIGRLQAAWAGEPPERP